MVVGGVVVVPHLGIIATGALLVAAPLSRRGGR